MEQRTVTIKNFSRITKIVQVSAMKVHFQIAERSLFYLNPDIHYRRMTYLPEREKVIYLMEIKFSDKIINSNYGIKYCMLFRLLSLL